MPSTGTLEAVASLFSALLGQTLTTNDLASLCRHAARYNSQSAPATFACCFQDTHANEAVHTASLNLKFLEQAASELHSQEDAVLQALSKAAPVKDADILQQSVDVGKRIWLLRAAGWLPSGSDWMPVHPCQVTASTAQAAQVLAMDDSEFWAFRSTCDFFVRKRLPEGGFTPWVRAKGPSYLVSNSKAKGGGVTVHGDAAFMEAAGITADGDSSDFSDEEAEDLAAGAAGGGVSKRKRRKAAGPTIGTRPSESSKAQKAAGQSAVQVMLGSESPQEAFEQGLLRVDAPLVPLPQPWIAAASSGERDAVPSSSKSVPSQPTYRLDELAESVREVLGQEVKGLLRDPVKLKVADRLADWLCCISGFSPLDSAAEEHKPEQDAVVAKHTAPAPAANAVPAAPSSSFAFSVQLPGSAAPASGTPALSAAHGSDTDETDSEDDDVLDKYCFDGMGASEEEDEAGDIRQGAYVILARALQLQIQALTTTDEAKAVTNAAAGRCPAEQKESVTAGCVRAAAAVAKERAVLQTLLSRISEAEPEVLEFLGEDESDGGSSDSDSQASEEAEIASNSLEPPPPLAPAGAKVGAGAASEQADVEEKSPVPVRKPSVTFSAAATDADFESAPPRAGKGNTKAAGKKRRRW